MRFSTLSLPMKSIDKARKTLRLINKQFAEYDKEMEQLLTFAPATRNNLIARPSGGVCTVNNRIEEITKLKEVVTAQAQQEIDKYFAEYKQNITEQLMPTGRSLASNDDFILLTSGLIDNEQVLVALSQKYQNDSSMRLAINTYARKNNMPSAVLNTNTDALNSFGENFFTTCKDCIGKNSYFEQFVFNEKAFTDSLTEWGLYNEYAKGNGLNYMPEYTLFENGDKKSDVVQQKGTGEMNGTPEELGSLLKPIPKTVYDVEKKESVPVTE